MRILKLLGTVGAAALLAAAVSMPANSAEMANTQLKDASGKAVGDVDLMQTPAGVLIKLQIKGLTPGEHAFHVHAVGKCEAPFTSAGGHYDPGPAGNPDPDANHPYHMGDLPNLTVGADGKGQLDATTTRVTISDGPLTLLDADGSAIIIHGNPDQGITGESKSGVSGGPRVACGVITKK